MNKILVIGSYNVGLVVVGDKIPAIGETVMGRSFETGPGGKGSNQAISLARLNAPFKFLCRVGDDHFGKDALRLFTKENVPDDAVKVVPHCHTGVGLIMIDNQGHNSISVAPGANYHLSIDDLLDNIHLFRESNFLLIQLECRLEVVKKAIMLAKETGNIVVFNPAPAQVIDSHTLSMTDYITPNETEAQIMSGVVVTDDASAIEAANVLIKNGAVNVILTMGEKGCLWANKDHHEFFPAYKVATVDSTGAGDAFNAGFVFGLTNNYSIPEAIRFASAVAALSVTKMGTIDGLPKLVEVMAFQKNHLYHQPIV